MMTPIYWIPGPWPGRLGIMPRPRGGDWLEDEVESWKKAGVNEIVSALTEEEVVELDLAEEEAFARAAGLDYVNVPITDRGVPPSARSIANLIQELAGKLDEGRGVAIHCRQGIGRSSLLAACLLTWSGMAADAAFARIRDARGCSVPDTLEQKEWVAIFSRSHSGRLAAR